MIKVILGIFNYSSCNNSFTTKARMSFKVAATDMLITRKIMLGISYTSTFVDR
jgi:hypothetical protein